MALFLITIGGNAYGQTTFTLGTGTSTNAANSYPAPYGNFFFGAKHQILVRASELTAMGMTAGDISSLAFQVNTASGTPLQNFTIGIKATSSTSMTGTFETGLTSVYGPTNYTDVLGWNTHTFNAPFYWDGVSNLIVETCFNNLAWANNAQMNFTATPFNSVGYYRADQAGLCGAVNPATISSSRPNLRFEWLNTAVPPIAAFEASTQSTCTGAITFTDTSSLNPTSWQWNFGDGNTSALQNPSHTYLATGTYDVTLIACNAFGCDTLVQPNYVTVNLGGGAVPIPANCTPMTTAYCCGFGSTNFSFGSINSGTMDASVGYEDLTCISTNLFAGAQYTATISTPTPQPHNAAMWIDYNNDGMFDDISERVLTSSSAYSHSGNITISNLAVQNTPLRLRISTDYDLQTPPTPCLDLAQGQVEDYTVIIQVNTSPPTPDFAVSDTLTCDGTIYFTDLTTDLPTSWYWDFGDGNFSNQQNPTHTYTMDGTYTVILYTTNVNGTTNATYNNLITVATANATTVPSCAPSTLAYCCDYGIYNVTFNTINFSSPNATEGYQDNTCLNSTTIIEGQTYPMTVQTGASSPQDTKVWIDFNDDGVFDNTTELVMNSSNEYNPTANILVPGAVTLNTALRMRVMSDIVGATMNPCSNQTRGQTEDYSVTITPNPFPPVASFTVDSATTCNGTFNFTDQSTQGPTTWSWNFGDGVGTSALPNPTYTYGSAGSYTVVLFVTNSNGTTSSSLVVTVDPALCNVSNMPTAGTVTNNFCSGTVYDDGGPLFNYSPNTNGTFIIDPPNASQVTLNFSFWNFVVSQPGDTLHVYDGNSTSAPLIGSYTGNATPNGGTITSTGGAITLRQETNNNVQDPGFALTWTCVESPSIADFSADSLTTCDGTTVFTDLTDNGPAIAWDWDFGDGVGTSTLQNPTYTYTTPGTYTVTLTAWNAIGPSSTTLDITYDPTFCILPVPTADFTSDVTTTCTGFIQFTDLSTNNPNIWVWNFNDGSPANNQQNPMHTFTVPGIYTVSLSAFNANGADSETKTGYINFDPTLCDTTFVPTTGTFTTETTCTGTIMDNGATGNYTNNTNGETHISVAGASVITLTFSAFDFDNSDTLYIYDGATTGAALIGAYTGNFLPNGGTVVSTGGDLTIVQVTDASNTAPGFTATWSCNVGLEDTYMAGHKLTVSPNPTSSFVSVMYTCDENCSNAELTVEDALGRVISTQSYGAQRSIQENIDLSNLTNGVYFISIKTNHGRLVQKIIKQ